MRIVYVDIDSLRPDHLGCYGYPRNTSPNIDQVAQRGVRLTQAYTSDAPCLPSRTALFRGRLGIQTGVVGHAGSGADPFPEGVTRRFRPLWGERCWMAQLRQAGYRTATVSTFGERHSAWPWYAGFNDVFNHGTRGRECADEVWPYVERWLDERGRQEDWFLHVNFWDAHIPYRVPPAYGDPFADEPAPVWLTPETLEQRRQAYGPHSASETWWTMWDVADTQPRSRWPRMQAEIRSLADFKSFLDAYDTGIRWVDEHVGRIMNALADLGVLDDTLVVVSADHGENLGELNVFGDHHTADLCTCHIPMIVAGPGVAGGRVDTDLHHHLDLAPTVLDFLGLRIPEDWDGSSFAPSLRGGSPETVRSSLVLSQGAWSCQRAVRWDRWLLMRTYDPGLKELPPLALYQVDDDPHEEHDLAASRPEIVHAGLAILDEWYGEQMSRSESGLDPMWMVLKEGGPSFTRGRLQEYCRFLENTGRADAAQRLLAQATRRGIASGVRS